MGGELCSRKRTHRSLEQERAPDRVGPMLLGGKMNKEERLLRVGVLGCGPIAQFAHFDACRKARNAELYAICDAAEELVTRMAVVHQPRTTYSGYDAMLADPLVEAVIIATAD